jgi:hypothetical protein
LFHLEAAILLAAVSHLPTEHSIWKANATIPFGISAIYIFEKFKLKAALMTIQEKKGVQTCRLVEYFETINGLKHIDQKIACNASIIGAAAKTWYVFTFVVAS